MTDERIAYFLTGHLRTQYIGHSGSSLFVHLKGTRDLLAQWNNDERVCRAGLYHSIYGTWHFRRKAFPIADRPTIRDVIGEAAERLVYLFCVTRRPDAFLALYADGALGQARLMDCHANAEIDVTRAELTDLLEIEAVNLLEQRGTIAGYLRKILRTDVSAGAKAALTDYLSDPGNR